MCRANMCICIYICLYVRGCVYIYIWICISVFAFDLFIPVFFFVYPFLSFSFWLEGHNENKAFLPFLCYPSHCWCCSYLSALIFSFNLYILTFNQFVCLFVLLRSIFRFNKSVIFQVLYSFPWLWRNKTYLLTYLYHKVLVV